MYRCAWLELNPKPTIYSIYAVSIFCWNCWDIWDMMESVISENIEIFPPQIWWIHIVHRIATQQALSGPQLTLSVEKKTENIIDFNRQRTWARLTIKHRLKFQIRFVGKFFWSRRARWDTVWSIIIIRWWGLHVIIFNGDRSMHQLFETS